MNNETSEILSSLTSIGKRQLDRLFRTMSLKICDDTLEAIYNGESVAAVDVGIGTLRILIEGDEIRYKFIPSRILERDLIDTIKTKKSPIETVLEETIDARINEAYKELF